MKAARICSGHSEVLLSPTLGLDRNFESGCKFLTFRNPGLGGKGFLETPCARDTVFPLGIGDGCLLIRGSLVLLSRLSRIVIDY